MNRLAIASRVRSYTRDFSSSIFRQVDILAYINEAIERCQEVIPQLAAMVSLDSDTDSPILLPSFYHYLLSVYSASRCFAQDERQYQAVQLMNEFETKLDELKSRIENGSLVIKGEDGVVVDDDADVEYVVMEYFTKRPSASDDFDTLGDV